MTDSIEDLKWRYAVKKFDSEKIISKDKVQRLKEAFKLTATSYGLQPIKMVVIQNKKLQEKLVEYSYGQNQVAEASHLLILCIENVIDESYIEDYFKLVKNIRGTEDKILNPFKEMLVDSFSKKDKDQIKAWATKQAYLALGNLLTICAIEKIDACPMEGFVPSAYDELLKLDTYGVSSVLVLPIGCRAIDDQFSSFKKVRKNLLDTIIEIQ